MVLLLVIGAAGDFWRAAHVTRTGLPAGAGTGFAAGAGGGSGAPGPDPGAPAAPVSAAAAAGGRIDLNTAGVRELDALPGIGPVLAERIVEHRRVHGRFRNADELLAVRGIGPKLFARLQPLVTASAAEPERAPATGGERER